MYNSFGFWGWLDNISEKDHQKLEVVLGDVRDTDAIKVAMADCSHVIHLAALIAIPYSYQAPASYIDTNIKGTLNVLQAAKELGVARIIHTSTSEVYGTARYVPIDEQHPLQGQSPYSASKIAADQLAYSFYTSFNVPVVTIRPFNTYGPRQSARAVIPTIITQIGIGAEKVKLGKLTPTRDFNYIDDTVAGFITALKASKIEGKVFNIGSNFEISIGDTANIIAELMTKKVEFETDTKRLRPADSEVDRLWADNSLAIKELGWEPKFSGRNGFVRGLQHTINWFLKKKNLRGYKSQLYNL